jgi:hypothetical protein
MSYDETVGRWTAEDPIAFEGGDANLYRFVGNSPTNGTDPTGLIDDGQGGHLTGSSRPGPIWGPWRPTNPVPPPPWLGPVQKNPTAAGDFNELWEFVHKLPKDVPWWDPCYTWAGSVNIPNKFEPLYQGPDKSPINVRRVCWDIQGALHDGGHTAFEVTFPDGSVIYFDEGGPWSTFAGALGGPDRWFGPGEIPNNYKPVSCIDQASRR